MLSQQDNEALCRVGPGTLMGDLMRQYWHPFLYSWELEPDGPPLRVRLLGEDLIAFRDTSGRVGLIADNCAHRGASMFYGRNEECGLRCVYHGWKFDADGNCVDMPSEPAESNFKAKVHMTAYRTAERGGIVFAYLGPVQSNPPGVPHFEWMDLPESQVHHEYKAVISGNYMQSMEGDIDTAHLFFLHGRLRQEDPGDWGVFHRDRAPQLFVTEREYGLLYAARRVQSPEEIYWRTTQYLMPVSVMFPAFADGVVPQHIWVPIDDEHTLTWGVKWHPARELADREPTSRKAAIEGMGHMRPEQYGKPYAGWWPVAAEDNDYLLDREVQRNRNYTGIPSIRLQDAAMTASMGAIQDRTKEHLGTTDAMIIKTRQRLLRAARALREQGVTPPGVDVPERFRVRSCSAVLPADVDWQTALEEWHQARSNDVMAAQLAGGDR